MESPDLTDDRIARYADGLRRLADAGQVLAASQYIRELQFADVRARPKGEPRLTRDEEDAQALRPFADAFVFLGDESATLLPAWVDQFIKQVRAAHEFQLAWEARIKTGGDLPDIGGRVNGQHQLLLTLQAAGARLDPHIAPIVAALATIDRDANHELAASLKHTGPGIVAATPKLLTVLREDGIWRWPSHLARALANAARHDPTVVPALRGLFAADDAETRRSAMEVLGAIGPGATGAADQLLAFRNGSRQDRCSMISALSKQGVPSPEFLDILDAAMRDPDGYVRRAAAYALGRLTPDAARFVPLLTEALDWTEYVHDQTLPDAATDALAQYGPRAAGALPRLLPFLDGPLVGRTIDHRKVRNAVERIAPGRAASARTETPTVDPADLPADEPLFAVHHDGHQCYVDRRGRIAIRIGDPSAYGQAFSEGRAIVQLRDGMTLVIDRHGAVVFKHPDRNIQPFSQGLAAFSKEKKWGFLDADGRVVIEPAYDSLTAFSEGLAGFEVGQTQVPLGRSGSMRKSGLRGYIDRTGRIVIPPSWSGAFPFHEGLAAVCIGGIPSAGDKPGEATPFSDRKYGFIDPTGRLIIPGQYDSPSHFSGGRASVATGTFVGRERHGYIDAAGRPVTPLVFTSASDFHDGCAMVRPRGRRWRDKKLLIDPAGHPLRELPYRRIDTFAEGRAAAQVGELYGFLDLAGHWAVAPQFDQVEAFKNGLAAVQRGDWYCLIDRDGNIVWGPTTEDKIFINFPAEWT